MTSPPREKREGTRVGGRFGRAKWGRVPTHTKSGPWFSDRPSSPGGFRIHRLGGPTLLPADAERVGMPAVATVTSYAEQGLTAVAVALSALALLVWGYHLLGPSTAETMASAFLWTFLTVCAWAVMLVVERLGGA